MLKIGMPAGSLADSKRGGNLIQLLHNAGFPTKGYDAGGPSRFSTMSSFIGWDGRPQEFGAQLGLNEIDVAIGGNDWIRERILEFKYEYSTEIELSQVMSLGRGSVRLVGIVDAAAATGSAVEYVAELINSKGRISVVSELPYTALDWVSQLIREAGLADEYKAFSVQKYKTPPRIEKGIIIYETWGKTESKIKNGGADLGLEITQTGSALRNYGLEIIDEVYQSETAIWVQPALYQDPEKKELLEMFLLNLSGALNAENKLLLLFNVPNDQIAVIDEYIASNSLFANEPTRNEGVCFCEYSLQVDTTDCNNPVPRIRYELAKRGAQNIDTVPLLSSIQSMDSLGQG